MTEPERDQFTVIASDGYPITCHRWRPAGLQARQRVMVLHGIQSHAGWYVHLAEVLAGQGLEVLMPDRRGSGANLQARGHAASSHRLTQDIHETLNHWNSISSSQAAPALAGISWGGKLAALAVAQSPNSFGGLALVAPGLFAKVRPPVATQLAIAFCALVRPKRLFDIPLSDPSLFTLDSTKQEFIATDPATLHQATARFFIVSRSIDFRLRSIRRKLIKPILLQLAEHDRIVNNDKIMSYVEQSPTLAKTLIRYPEAHHTLEFEPVTLATRYALDMANWAKAI